MYSIEQKNGERWFNIATYASLSEASRRFNQTMRENDPQPKLRVVNVRSGVMVGVDSLRDTGAPPKDSD